MIKKKLTAGLVILVATHVMLAGCGSTQGTPTKTAAGNSQTTESSQVTAEAAAKADTSKAEAAAKADTSKAEEAAKADASKADASKAEENTAAADSSAAGAKSDAQTAAGEITLEEALKAALEEAGLTDADVVVKRVDLDTDDGVRKYEVEFYANDTEFDYDIDAMTASVLSAEKDTMDAEDYTEMEALLNSGSEITGTKEAAAGSVTEDGALEIALKEAGVAAGDVTASRVEQDYDDDRGKTVYDVEFHVGNVEYSYEIDAETGTVYESEVDTDD